MKIIKIILAWLGWKFREVKHVADNLKVAKYSQSSEKKRRKGQIKKGYLTESNGVKI